MRIGRVVLLAAAVATAGCNLNTTSVISGGGNNTTCSVSLQGALSGTYDCQPAVTTWAVSDNSGAFSFGVAASGATPAISVAIVWVGEPALRTYANTDSAAQASLTVTNSSGQSWHAAVGPGVTATGQYTLTFDSVSVVNTTAAGKTYAASGTMSASLQPVSGTQASGTLVVIATF